MKDFHLKILAIIMIIFGIFGLSTLPFLSIIVQYIDSITGFSSGNGYLTNNMDYLFKSPLIYIGGFFVFSIILAIIYLVYSFFKAKRGWLLMKKIISMVLSLYWFWGARQQRLLRRLITMTLKICLMMELIILMVG